MAAEEQSEAEGAMDDTRPIIKARARLSHPVVHTGSTALVFLRVDVNATETNIGTHSPQGDLAVARAGGGSQSTHHPHGDSVWA